MLGLPFEILASGIIRVRTTLNYHFIFYAPSQLFLEQRRLIGHKNKSASAYILFELPEPLSCSRSYIPVSKFSPTK
jgi:hypothetical protein